MRVIYVTSSMPYGVGEAFLIPELEGIRRRGHEVLVVPMYPRGSVLHGDAKPLLGHTETQPLFSLDIAKTAVKEILRVPAKSLNTFNWLLRSRSNGILLKNLAVYPKGLWLARLAREWRADHIHAHWTSVSATLALIASEVSDIPWSCTAHRWDIVENNLLALKLSQASFVRFISQSGLNLAKKLGIDGLEAKALILHMGVSLGASSGGTDGRAGSATPVVLCPANLRPVKGHKYLIEAVAILTARGVDLELWVAGKGGLLEELQEQAKRLGLSSRIRFVGPLSHSELMELYRRRKITVVALASVDLGGGEHEGIPVSLMEAMSYRIPVVSTNTGGIPELLGAGAGSLVPPASPAALAEAIGRLIDDPEIREKQGDAGRERVEAGFAAEKVVEELILRFETVTR